MQRIVKSTVFVGVLCMVASVQAATTLGKIHGTVNYCEQGGVLGMKVSLSGRQASIFTAPDGRFLFESLPAGTYALFYTMDETLLHVSQEVIVNSGQTTELGEIAFCDVQKRELNSMGDDECPSDSPAPECVDHDKDGVVAAKDCDDNDEHTRPGAPERCDGKDNNCNGSIDDVGAVWLENGVGICHNGAIAVQSCSKGFADCDAKAANGCETDIMRDRDHCGACGNTCPSLEICVAGIC